MGPACTGAEFGVLDQVHQGPGSELGWGLVFPRGLTHPVYDTKPTKGSEPKFWWRNQVGTNAITDEAERDQLIARRWG